MYPKVESTADAQRGPITNAAVPPTRTLNERLNRALTLFSAECDRIENVLSRINGTPGNPSRQGAEVDKTPQLSMVIAVENLEQLCERLHNLRQGVEAIA